MATHAGEQELAMLTHLLGLLVRLPLLIWLLHADTRRLPAAQRARAWPSATQWSAPSLIGPLALLWHALRTRRSLRGLALGLGVTLAETLLWAGLFELLGWLWQLGEH